MSSEPDNVPPAPHHEPGEVSALMKDSFIGRGTALSVAVLFMLTIVIPPIHQVYVEQTDAARPGWRFARLFKQFPTHDSLKQFENELARDSDLSQRVRIPYQTLCTKVFNQGAEKVFIGRDEYLFYRKEIDFARGPGFLSERFLKRRAAALHPADDVFARLLQRVFTGNASEASGHAARNDIDPVEAIADYHRRLKERGISLLVVPIPAKPIIYPDKVSPGYNVSAGAAWNRDYAVWNKRLANAGVETLDLTADFWDNRTKELFLRGDTHWSPVGMELAADRIATRVTPFLGKIAPRPIHAEPATIERHGDLHAMLELPEDASTFKPSKVTISHILDGTKPVEGGDGAPVLLLGDSYTNIYSDPGLKWGEDAGLAEQLALRLGVPVQTIAQNGGGATSVRKALLARPEALTHKAVVVWAFSVRDLYDEGVAWEHVALPAPAAAANVRPVGGTVVLAELLEDLPRVDAKSGPYVDALVTLKFHLKSVESGKFETQEFLITMPLIISRVAQPAAQLVKGKTYRLPLLTDVPKKMKTWQRAKDAEGEDLLLESYFAEEIKP